MAHPASNDWFLGVDLGTGSCKTVVVDAQARVLGFGASEYLGSSIQAKWQEQDPQAVFEGMLRAVRAALADAGELPGECAGMSIGGALHSVMALDRSDKPLTGLITWADNRAFEQAERVRNSPQAFEMYQQTGCPPNGMYPVYKIAWLEQERPDIFEQARRFLSAKEYVFWRLTNQFVVDYGLAGGSGLLNVHTLDYHGPALELAGITPGQLSRLGDPRQVFHLASAETAESLGLSPQTPLVLGSSDAANSTLGVGAVHPWEATCMVGTSGAFRVISPRPVLDERIRSFCYAVDPAHWLVGGGINNGGIVLSWFLELLNQAFPHRLPEDRLTFDRLLELAAQAAPGSGGLLCLPFLAGERSPNWNQNTRAVFFGMTLNHTIHQVARSLLEGIAFRLRSLNDVLSEMRVDTRQVRASGGFTHSSLWLQIVASVLDRELVVPTHGETSSLGASFWAMLGVGALSSLEESGELVTLARSHHPITEETRLYERLYTSYTRLYQDLGPAFSQIAAFQKGL
jgi:gluconokinase